MKYVSHLLTLIDSFSPRQEEETSIAIISEILNCSERHVKTIIKYLHLNGYILWKTQKGRGNKPYITIQVNRHDLLYKDAKEKVLTGNYKGAFTIIHELPVSLQQSFQKWFMEKMESAVSSPKNNRDIWKYPFYATDLCLDPLHMVSRHDGHIVQQIYERLVEFHTESGILEPRLSHHWESGDGKTWTFYLRKDVFFHNGKELTSKDVKYTIERLRQKGDLFQSIQTINTCKKLKVMFELADVNYLFPRYFSSLRASIIPMEWATSDTKGYQKYPVGSGPYQLTQNNDEKICLEVFSDYYKERPWLDEIEIIITPHSYLPKEEHPLLLKAPNDTWKKVEVLEEGATYIAFNCHSNSPMQDKAIRANICRVLNPGHIKNEARMNERVAYSFVTKQSQNHNVNATPSIDLAAFDSLPVVKIAAQQIRKGTNHEKAAKNLQVQLQKYGIQSKIEVIDQSRLKEASVLQKFDMVVGGIALSNDLLLTAINALQSKRVYIYTFLNSIMQSHVDRNIRLLKGLRDESARWEAYFQLEEYLTQNNVLFFLNHRYHTMYEPKDSVFGNVTLDSNGRVDYRKVYRRE